MAETYGNGAHLEASEWNFLGMLEANDGIFMDLDLEPFAKK